MFLNKIISHYSPEQIREQNARMLGIKAAPQRLGGFIVKVDVEKGKAETYYAGPFRGKKEAEMYIEKYHGDLDNCEVFPLRSGIDPDSQF